MLAGWMVTKNFATTTLTRYFGMTKRTTNINLQNTLDAWVHMLSMALEAPRRGQCSADVPSREDIIDQFVRTFVPLDVEEADIEHYGSNLKSDDVSLRSASWREIDCQHVFLQEFFESLVRELAQCCTGQGVESILTSSNVDPSTRTQVEKATYVLLPPEGTCKYMLLSSCCVLLIMYLVCSEFGSKF